MKIGFKDVVTILATKHAIDSNRSVAFRGRLEHLRRLGYPQGVQTGKGKTAIFGWSEILQLTVAVDLLNLGLSPEATVRIFKHLPSDKLLGYFAYFVKEPKQNKKLNKAVKESKWPFSSTQFLLITPLALSGLKGVDNNLVPGIWSFDSKKIVEELRVSDAGAASNIIIDLGTILANLIALISDMTESPYLEIIEDYRQFIKERFDYNS